MSAARPWQRESWPIAETIEHSAAGRMAVDNGRRAHDASSRVRPSAPGRPPCQASSARSARTTRSTRRSTSPSSSTGCIRAPSWSRSGWPRSSTSAARGCARCWRGWRTSRSSSSIPQRGAYVAKPSIEQAVDVFEARRLIEPALLRRLVRDADAREGRAPAPAPGAGDGRAPARRQARDRAAVRRVPHAAGRAGGQLGAGAQHARALDADLPDHLSVRHADRDELPRRRALADRRGASPSATRRAPRS